MLALLGGCGDDTPSLTSSAEEAARVLPADARFVTRLDLRTLQQNSGLTLSSERGITLRLLDSDVTFNPLSEATQSRLQAFIDATGFDPASDLESVYAAVPGDSSSPGDQSLGFAILADMNPDQLRAYLADQDSLVSDGATYRDVPVYHLTTLGTRAPQFALLSDRLIAVAPTEAALHQMIDRYQGRTSTLADRTEGAHLFAESVHEGSIGMVAYDLGTQRLLQTVDQEDSNRFTRIGRAVRDVVATFDPQKERVHGRLLLTTDQNASDLADVVKGAIAAVKTGGDLSEAERAMLDRIQVSSRDDTVTITFDMEIEQLARWVFDQPRLRT